MWYTTMSKLSSRTLLKVRPVDVILIRTLRAHCCVHVYEMFGGWLAESWYSFARFHLVLQCMVEYDLSVSCVLALCMLMYVSLDT